MPISTGRSRRQTGTPLPPAGRLHGRRCEAAQGWPRTVSRAGWGEVPRWAAMSPYGALSATGGLSAGRERALMAPAKSAAGAWVV